MFAPTRTLLHTYNGHDDDDDDDDHDDDDDWGNNFIRDQNSPPPLNNMLVGVRTSDAAQRQSCSEHA